MEQIINQLVRMTIYILLGIYLQKRKNIPENCGQVLSFLVVEITMPCTVLSAFLNTGWNVTAGELIMTFIYYIAVFFCVMIIAKVSGFFLGIPDMERGLWEFLLLFPNNIFIGFPVIESVMGTEALIYASLACIPCNTLIFSYGLYLVGKQSAHYQFGLREIVNPCTLVSGIALILVIGDIHIPESVSASITTVGSISTPLSLIVLGMMIARTFHIKVFKKKEIWGFCVLRLFLIPVLTGFVFVLWKLPFQNIIWILILTAGMPASNTAIVLCERFRNNAAFATECVVVSTILFFVLFPVFINGFRILYGI